MKHDESSSWPIIVTGMHRSGTSLIGNYLKKSNIDMGEELLGPNESNIYGHFEDKNFLEFHQSILIRDFGHHMWANGVPKITRKDFEKANSLVENRKGKKNWGWKEPRTALFLDLWKGIFPQATFVFMVRHPLEVVDSLERRKSDRGKPSRKLLNKFLSNWILHNSQCYWFALQFPSQCLIFHLSELIKKQEEFAKILSNKFQYDFNPEVLFQIYDPDELYTNSKTPFYSLSPLLVMRSHSLHNKMRNIAAI